MIGIYCIKNIFNDKMYIGKSVNIEDRLAGHIRCLNNNYHHSIKLQRSWNKNSENSFIYGAIEECDECDLDFKELYYINLYDSYNNGYNCVVPTGINSGYHHNDETKRKHSISMRVAHARMNPEEKERILSGLRNSPYHGGMQEQGVLLYDAKTFEFILSFSTTKECSEFLNCSKMAVNKAIDLLRFHDRMSFKGYILIRNKSIYNIESYIKSRKIYCDGVKFRKAIRSGLAIINNFTRKYNEAVRVRNNAENRNTAWKLNSLKSKDGLRSSGKHSVDIYKFDTGEYVGRWNLLSDFASEYRLRLESLRKVMCGERRYCHNFVVKKVN